VEVFRKRVFLEEKRKDYEDEKKIRPTNQNLHHLRATIYVAKEVGESLGRSKILCG
jgi:hypothetical protein